MIRVHSILIVAVVAAVSLLIKELPFIVFGGRRELPKIILYLSNVLPYAIIGMLVVYCLKDVHITEGSHGLPEFLACGFVALIHIWRKNILLSVVSGTILYMFLIQYVF
jgi:branched-subunit amino acid transport protein AzlD